MPYLDTILLIVSALMMIVGLAGCLLPILPGPPIAYAGLLLLQATRYGSFSITFFLVLGAVTVLVTALDYLIPVWGTKKFGGSRRGVIGAVVGLIIGLVVFPPFGIIIGPFAGALLGELTTGMGFWVALKASFGSLAGSLLGTVMKLALTGVMIFYYARSLMNAW
ncbi:MAG: DUF456 domain-containing protein [Chrysiogenales bacterium]|nr:MAG: DUF456 domain-containing protein [Chrysiogenales bacterium]